MAAPFNKMPSSSALAMMPPNINELCIDATDANEDRRAPQPHPRPRGSHTGLPTLHILNIFSAWFEPYRPAANMEGNGGFDLWGIY